MKSLAALLAALVLSACASSNHISTTPTANSCEEGVGPCVNGKLAGKTSSTYIPFSSYTVDPVIATQEYVQNSLPVQGVPIPYSSNTVVDKILNRALIEPWSGISTLTIAPMATLKTNGSKVGDWFVIYNLGTNTGTVTVKLNDNCYSPIPNCANMIYATGDAYLYVLDVSAWRVIPLQAQRQSSVRSIAATSTIAALTDGDALITYGASPITVTINTAPSYGLINGAKLILSNMQNAGKTATFKFAEKIYVFNGTNAVQVSELVLNPGETTSVMYNGNTSVWYKYGGSKGSVQ
jgi:hypothetical protein